ncbi:MAG: hypothetical protein Q8Q74_17170 [Polaromonas sp.]|nr:hypothetical protein [Polaromonas sp.]
MGFFKESGGTTSSKSIARLQQLIWILIYGGLLTLVLGLSVQRMDDALGWSMVVAGGVVAAIGFVLIYVRSRLTSGD